MKPLSTPTKVYQDNFSPGKGNALQAAVASMFGQSLHDVPNFITSVGQVDLGLFDAYLSVVTDKEFRTTQQKNVQSVSKYYSLTIYSNE